ncbi:glycosyltransferase [Raineyella fluvialis]|uniref:Glycosyltransferase n=1 Tax=Raineyella fluvialis TaxID=2662261 RepID=A0A5Q2FIZ4_9ACTN|nr:glycosyltransferase [Raineyella fluvialis]
MFHSGVVDAWRERERALERAGADVTLLSAQRWNEGGSVVELQPRPGEKVRAVATIGSHPALFLYDPRPIWRALAEDWDVLDIHEEPFALATAEILLLRALRRSRLPYALYSAQNIRKRYPIPFRWLERHALRHAAGLQVCNAQAGRICEDKGFPGVARVIPLGLDPAHFHPGPAPAPQSAESAIVGYVGRLAAHKGLDVLLDAVAGDDRLRLRIAGDGPEAEELRGRVSAEGLAGRVEFAGSIEQVDLPDFYRSLDVLAVPSLTTSSWMEQFGRVAVEAMACGVPVVASDSGALPEVIDDAGILVPPGDADALREALVRVGTDPSLAASLRQRGLERAAAAAWDRVADEFKAMYRAMRHQGAHLERDVEVVLVAYRSPELVRRALEPVASLPVTVVDNSSMPQIRAVCEELGCRYVDSGRNGGFAYGVNTALQNRQVPGADVLLLNPDALVSVGDVEELHRALLADPHLASVGPSQVDGSGEASRVSWPFPSPRATWLEAVGLGRLAGRDRYVIGSVLMLRAEALAQVGGLDERFFLYAEETDWAYRACLLGWHHAEVKGVVAEHLGSATSSDSAARDAHFHASLERYLRKHHGAIGWQFARLGQVVGSSLRALVLPGARGSVAAARARTYVHGPVRLEAGQGMRG